MPLSTAAKAALCICPPAVMAGTVAAVPAARRAVHHLTAPHHHAHPGAAPRHVAATRGEGVARPPCDAPAGPLPTVPLVTYAEPIPAEPGGEPGGPGGGGGVGPGVIAAQAAVAAGPATSGPVPTPTTTPVTPTAPVPEPASWLLLIGGAGLLGAQLRTRQLARGQARARARTGGTLAASLWSVGSAEAVDTAATVAGGGAAKSMLAGAAGKALLCVCPAAVVAGSVVAVPPVRRAVHHATAPAVPALPAVAATLPCDPATTLPISAVAVQDYPATVTLAVAAIPPAAALPEPS